MTHVLIAVDDSETSVRAATTARRVFGDQARYTVLNVATNSPVIWGDDALAAGMVYPLTLPGAGVVGGIPFTVQTPGHPEWADTDRIDQAEQRADDVAREAGLSEARPVGDTGDPAEAILAAAHEYGADVIVVGTHDRHWFTRLFSRSVSDAIVRESDIPVLIAC
jgi:nucleotide-binding universal stress UspA family protein